MALIKRIWKCKYCSKKYKSGGFYFRKHFAVKHPGQRMACSEVRP